MREGEIKWGRGSEGEIETKKESERQRVTL